MSKPIDHIAIKQISEVLGEYSKGSELTKIFKRLNFYDHDSKNPQMKLSTKWRRIENTLNYECKKSKNAKPVFLLIQQLLTPAQFIKQGQSSWIKAKKDVNEILIFYGFELNDSGMVQKVIIAKNFTDAQKRLTSFNEKLEMYDIHQNVTQYCREELFIDNYFHAIFEASKGLSDRVRTLSETELDGSTLINTVFDRKQPIVIIRGNMLSTQADRSEYNGLKSLLNTIIYLYRNPKAHEPKLYNQTSETDAITAFTLMSLAHRILDNCINVRNITS